MVFFGGEAALGAGVRGRGGLEAAGDPVRVRSPGPSSGRQRSPSTRGGSGCALLDISQPHHDGSVQPRHSGMRKGSSTLKLLLGLFGPESCFPKGFRRPEAPASPPCLAGRGEDTTFVPKEDRVFARDWKGKQHSGEINHKLYELLRAWALTRLEVCDLKSSSLSYCCMGGRRVLKEH